MANNVVEMRATMSEAKMAAGAWFSSVRRHIRDSVVAHYHVLGRYTLPLTK